MDTKVKLCPITQNYLAEILRDKKKIDSAFVKDNRMNKRFI
jgi:hypothetical protein